MNEFVLLSIAFGVFLGGVFAITAVLSMLRRWRIARLEREHAELTPLLSEPEPPVSILPPRLQSAEFTAVDPLLDKPLMPVMQPVPRENGDQVTLLIEPDSGPTAQQRTIKKLIDFMKRPDKPTLPASSDA